MSPARLYLRCLGASIRTQMQFRASFLLLIVSQLLVIGMEVAGVWMLFQRFGQLRGWTLPEVALLFGIANVAFSLAEGIGRGFDTFSALIKSGEFDRLLLRPRGTAFQVAAHEVQLMRLGRLLPGLLTLGWALHPLHLGWLDLRWLTIAAGILGTAAVFYGLFVVQATLAFWTVESLEVLNTVTYGGVEVAQYPLPIYRPWFRYFFTLVVPLALTVFEPARTLLRPSEAGSAVAGAGLTLLVGGLFLGCSLRLWSYGVRHYRSTGS